MDLQEQIKALTDENAKLKATIKSMKVKSSLDSVFGNLVPKSETARELACKVLDEKHFFDEDGNLNIDAAMDLLQTEYDYLFDKEIAEGDAKSDDVTETKSDEDVEVKEDDVEVKEEDVEVKEEDVEVKEENGVLCESESKTGMWAWKHPHSDGEITYTGADLDEKGLLHIGLGDWCHVGTHKPKAPLEVTDTLMALDIATKIAAIAELLSLHTKFKENYWL